MPHVRSPERLDAARCGLLVIDLQEKLVPAIRSADNVVRQTRKLIAAAKLVEVPYAATVQYPQGLGPLVPELAEHFVDPPAEEKRDFSAAVCRGALDVWSEDGRDQIVIAGVETHVCVLQTVLDLIAEGQRPFVVGEAVASRHGRDHETAIDRMRDAGAVVITVESVLFEWLGTAAHPQFKAISGMIKN